MSYNLTKLGRNETWQGSPVLCLGYLEAITPSTFVKRPAVQADITSLYYYVVNRETGAQSANVTLDKTLVMFDTLQTGDIWDADEIDAPAGWNIKFWVDSSYFPSANTRYRIVLMGVFADSHESIGVWENKTIPRS